MSTQRAPRVNHSGSVFATAGGVIWAGVILFWVALTGLTLLSLAHAFWPVAGAVMLLLLALGLLFHNAARNSRR